MHLLIQPTFLKVSKSTWEWLLWLTPGATQNSAEDPKIRVPQDSSLTVCGLSVRDKKCMWVARGTLKGSSEIGKSASVGGYPPPKRGCSFATPASVHSWPCPSGCSPRPHSRGSLLTSGRSHVPVCTSLHAPRAPGKHTHSLLNEGRAAGASK